MVLKLLLTSAKKILSCNKQPTPPSMQLACLPKPNDKDEEKPTTWTCSQGITHPCSQEFCQCLWEKLIK